VASTSQNLDASQLGILLCAVIILAVISHRLPHMVAGMVVGGGHNGAIGGVGMMTLYAAGMTGMSLAGRLSGNGAAMLATEGVGEGAKMLQDRIAAVEAAASAQKIQPSASSDIADSGAGPHSSASADPSAANSGKSKGWCGRRSRSRSVTMMAGDKGNAVVAAGPGSGASSPGGVAGPRGPVEPPQERPMSADEARGFGADGNGAQTINPIRPQATIK
jgi:hypothetical protein